MTNRWDGYVKRVEEFTTRVIQEELGGPESYAADAGALAGVLDRVRNLEEALDDLSRSADTADLLLRQTCPDEASSLRQKVARAIEVLAK